MGFKLALMVIFISVIVVNALESTPTPSEQRIFESEPVPIETAPWQVSVRLKAFDMEYYGDGHICGGCVISQRVVLTAAHCIVNEELETDSNPDDEDQDQFVYRNPDEFTLVMGTHSLSEITPHTLQFDVQKIAVHVAFNLTNLLNDIAMFLINGEIPRNWPTVRPIPLNTASDLRGTLCSTSGWNVTNDETTFNLRANLVPIVEQSTCNAVYGELTTDLICAGYEETIEHEFCDGDSGGPLVCHGHLAGIILEGNSCARTGYRGLYVNVLYHYNWIVANNKTFDYSHHNEVEVNNKAFNESDYEEVTAEPLEKYQEVAVEIPNGADILFGKLGIVILILILSIHL